MNVVRTFVSPEHGEEQEEVGCLLCGETAHEPVLTASDLLFRKPGKYYLVRCAACGLEYVNPRPTPAALGPHYPPTYFGYARPEEAPWFARPFLLAFAKSIALRRIHYIETVTGKFRPEQQVVDVGCGANGLLRTLRDLRGTLGTGVDFTPRAVEYVRDVLKMPIVQGTLKGAGFKDAQFDTMTLLEYLEHEPDPMAILGEARRVIKDGGHLVVEIPHPTGWVSRLFGKYWWNLDLPRHLVFFSEQTLGKAFEKTGFELVRTRAFTLPLYVGSSIVQALGERHWVKNQAWFPLASAFLGAPFLPFQAVMPEFLFCVARAKP
ncbi:MAG TPA: class I SAM-dependent methyltransferase [Polyangiaceae bacterium]|nr:class I SAM-dependent methyltransferase [Polyangiaceae bacterium]